MPQPKGGYVPLKSFKKFVLRAEHALHAGENISASLVGTAVDYLTRFMLGFAPEKAFEIPIRGAYVINSQAKATFLLSHLKGLDDFSIDCACKLAGFDVCYRASPAAYRPIESIMPDKDTIDNIRIMVNRSISFWHTYGPVICCAPTFEGGYTTMVNAGDGDYLTEDTLWEFKVMQSSPTSKHTLQLMMYYIMGKHSHYLHFYNVNKIGIFNPRLNVVYIREITWSDTELIKEIENVVIGYNFPIESVCSLVPQNHIEIENKKYIPIEATMSVQDVCRETGFSSYKIYNAIHMGELNAYKKGGRYYIPVVDFEEYLEDLRRQQRNAIILGVVAGMLTVTIFVLLFVYFSRFMPY